MSFTSFPLEKLGLRKDQVVVCHRNNLHNAADILLAPTHELSKKLKWRIEAVQALVRDVSRAIAPRSSCVGSLVGGTTNKEAEGSGSGLVSGRGRAMSQARSEAQGAGTMMGTDSSSQLPIAGTGGAVVSVGGMKAAPTGMTRRKSMGASSAAPSAAEAGAAALPAGASQLGTQTATAAGAGVNGKGKARMREPGGEHAEGDWISTGDEGWDRLLGGGVRLASLVEISGESAAGKSHLALSLSIAAQLPTLSTLPGGTLFLTSEREISTSRLKDISRHMLATHGKSDFRTPSRLMQGVMTRRVGDVDELETALGYWVPVVLDQAREGVLGKGKPRGSGESEVADGAPNGQEDAEVLGTGQRLMGFPSRDAVKAEYDTCRSIVNAERLNPAPLSALTKRTNGDTDGNGRTNAKPLRRTVSQAQKPRLPIRLLVLDSITALLRGSETAFSSSSAGLTARSRFLCSTADRLKALAVEYNLAVLVINQVSDVIDRRGMTSVTAKDQDEDEDDNDDDTGGMRPPPMSGNGGFGGSSQVQRGSQHPSSSQSQPGLTHSQAWATTGPDPPMLYATQSKWFSGQSSARTKEAALGVVWANAINVRLMLSRTGRRRVLGVGDVQEGAERGTKRRLVDNVRSGGDESGVAMAQARAVAAGGGTLPTASASASAPAGYAGGMNGFAAATSQHVISTHRDEVQIAWQDAEDDIEEERILVRRAACVFSPTAPPATVDYVITASGIHTLNGSWKRHETGEGVMKRQKRLRAALAGQTYTHAAEVGEGREEEDEDDPYGDKALDGLMDVPDEWWNGDVENMSSGVRADE